jgi:biopolymer transport protein ExbD
MAASVGTEGKGSVNVELNIVPFIDLMSCLTAFLLVTAVWVNINQLDVKPAGKARDTPPCVDDPTCDEPKLSVLVDGDGVWIGVSRVNEFQSIPKLAAGGYDWPKVADALKAQKKSPFFDHKTGIEIAANSTAGTPIGYNQLITAMDVAVQAGFIDVGLTDPNGLSARPTL